MKILSSLAVIALFVSQDAQAFKLEKTEVAAIQHQDQD